MQNKKLKILHTADWHLGQKFFHKDRKKEHQAALDWLVQLIDKEAVDVVILAGDVFDVDNPPNYARKMYLDFLCRLIPTTCRQIVVVAGNHDSANLLDAEKNIMDALDVFVVGNLPEDRVEQLLPIKNSEGDIEAVIAAVPFLRDRDLRSGKPVANSLEERVQQIREGVATHYAEVWDAITTSYQNYQDIPIIGTGHLFVADGQRGDRANSIHIGCSDVITAEQFPEGFDYIALGHLHRPQYMKGFEHIHYSGTLIPLDFSELNYEQIVKIVEFEGKELIDIRSVAIPQVLKIRHYKGDKDKMLGKFEQLDKEQTVWMKLEVEVDSFEPNLQAELEQELKKYSSNAEILTTKQQLKQTDNPFSVDEIIQSLGDLSAKEVFDRCLDEHSVSEENSRKELADTFVELLSDMASSDRE